MNDFDRFIPHLDRALAYAKHSHTVEDVRAAVERGDAQLWPGVQSVIITEIVQMPQWRELRFWLAAGDMTELRAMYPVVEEFGRRTGCQYCTMTGRDGWARSFLTKDEGWTAEATLYMKELEA